MKNTLMKKFVLTMAFATVLSAGLAGCGQPAQASPGSEPQSGASVTVPGSPEDSREVPSAEEEPEDGASVNPQENDPASDMGGDTAAAGASTPDGTPPEIAAGPDAAVPDAGAEPVQDESQAAAPAGESLSGIDLNVQFGDDGASFALHLYDNETAAAIARHVGTADWRLPIYNYEGYDNWEVMQYYDIPSRYEIPSNPQDVTSERAGAVYYSEPNRIVLFFGDANVSSEYTPVGYIDDSQEFVDAVENNPVLEGWGNKIVKISR